MTALLEVEGLHAHYGKSHILHGVGPCDRGRRNRQSARAQRLGSLDHAEDHHGVGAADGGRGATRRRRPCRQAGIQDRARGDRLRAGGARDLRQPDGRREHSPRHPGGARAACQHGRRSRCTTTFRSSRSAATPMPECCRAASSRCSPSVARCWVTRASMLIDEPTEGLAPKIVKVVAEVICDICRKGVAVLLVEQKLTIAMRIAQRVYVMGHGQIVFEGTPADAPQCTRGAAGMARGRVGQWLSQACEVNAGVPQAPRRYRGGFRTPHRCGALGGSGAAGPSCRHSAVGNDALFQECPALRFCGGQLWVAGSRCER